MYRICIRIVFNLRICPQKKKASNSQDLSMHRRKRGETEDNVLSHPAHTDIAQIIFQKEDFRFYLARWQDAFAKHAKDLFLISHETKESYISIEVCV